MLTAELEAIRREMSHQVLPAEKWPLFDIRASRLKDGWIRLHVSWDALIADAWSFFSFTSDWYEFYRNPETEVTPLDISFRDYVLAEADLQDSELYRRAKEYWTSRLPDLPPAPELPLAREPASIKQPRFNRRGFRLPAQVWQNLKDRATRNNLTPSGLLIAAYADVLSVWSKNPRFTINLTLFNRLPLHPQVNNIVGDFTSTILLGVESSEKDGFAARASRLQRQLWQDLDHRYFSGVQVLRELARLRGDFKKSVMPVVFTSALNMEALGCDVSGVSKLGEMVYSISQTPQVWLDHQVYEQDGELVLTWDAVEELFPEGLLDDMFAAYCGFLQRLAEEEDAWQRTARHLIPAAQLEKRAGVNATEAPLSPEMLHTLFHNQVPHRQDHPAVISSNRTLSYQELFTCSNHIGHLLREKGAEPNSLVAVVMEKGWEQVVAVLGILNSGAAYLPLDSELPGERIRHLLADGKVDLVLTQSWLDEMLEWPDGIRRFFVDKAASAKEDGTPLKPAQGPDDLAYVIYTSGSTGFPKGVMISHRGAVNTILDVNKRFDLGPEDRVLAISNLNFDLSVYDIFGTLAAGGTIVFPDPDKAREPAHWLDLTTDHRITVWNSVPALMRMFEEYLSGGTDAAPLSLRLILLSGDWIPLDLPDKIKSYCNGVRVIGLGGATEASIWSNLCPIEKINPNWKSIPYGYPMLNQRFHVFNESMEDCPEWVPGQLYIGGIGLAKGYWRDEEKTKSSFIVCPQTGERLYRTGDFGRYLPDGSIEFLGREDFQIKINGYRIELGEIETTLKRLPGVKDAVVTVTEGTGKEKQLAGYVVPNHEKESVLFESKHVDSAWCASRWDSVRSVGLKEALQIPGSIDIASVPSFINSVEYLSFVIICRILHNMGIFSHEGEGYSIDELMRRFEIQPRYRTLLLHWLEVLVEERVLEKSEAASYQNRHSLHKQILQFPPNPSKDLTELYSSLKNSISICTDLLKGNSDPIELLLSENTFLTAERLDSIAPGREYYLNLAGRLFSTIADSFPSDRNLRVLEVGTRAGNLTGDLLSLLPKDRGSYVYTDESSVFTDKIREKWGSFSSLEYGLLNVNKSPGEQGYEPFSFDVIIADKTLHRAKHLEMTLKYVKELLAPGGLLFVTEPTQNNRLMLISVGFFEDGFAHFEDERNANHLPFIPVEKWRDLLEKTGFSKIMTFPEDGHAAGAFGQHVIVAQVPETVSVFESSNIADALRRKIPDYMVPVRYMLLDKLPLTANMKVDRKALEKLGKKPEQISRETYVAPFTGIQIRIASAWKEMLGHTRIGIHDNFFELGGDSLRAIQCINLLKEAYRVNFSLREFFEGANVERLAKKIEEKLEREKNLVMEEGEI
jgi:yersiniabactin nonribosomal peptide synthetase